MTSITVPIKENGKTIGVAGVDIALAALNEELGAEKPTREITSWIIGAAVVLVLILSLVMIVLVCGLAARPVRHLTGVVEQLAGQYRGDSTGETMSKLAAAADEIGGIVRLIGGPD